MTREISQPAFVLFSLVFGALNSKVVVGLTELDFYQLSANEAVTLPKGDDKIAETLLSPPFFFFGSTYEDIYVSTNGQISVQSPEEMLKLRMFPTDKIIIAPFWADVDTRDDGGDIAYGVTRNNATLARAQDQIRAAYPDIPFTPVYLFIANWTRVGYYLRNTNLRNTFQCVLATDFSHSFILFLYPEGGLQWTAGDTHGILGRSLPCYPAAIAGFNFENGSGSEPKYENLPHSGNDTIVELAVTSNVGSPGLWIFRVDEEDIIAPPIPETSPAPSTTPEITTNGETTLVTPLPITIVASPTIETTSSLPAGTDSVVGESTDSHGVPAGVIAGVAIGVIMAVCFVIIAVSAIAGYVIVFRKMRAARKSFASSPETVSV